MIREVRIDEVRSGMASSGFVEWLRSGRKCLYGSGCLSRTGARSGTSVLIISLFLGQVLTVASKTSYR